MQNRLPCNTCVRFIVARTVWHASHRKFIVSYRMDRMHTKLSRAIESITATRRRLSQRFVVHVCRSWGGGWNKCSHKFEVPGQGAVRVCMFLSPLWLSLTVYIRLWPPSVLALTLSSQSLSPEEETTLAGELEQATVLHERLTLDHAQA
jgi:hypothetical protein